MLKILLLASALTGLAGCSREEPPVSVANRSEAIADTLEARANALEMQANNMADGEVAAAMANAADALDASADDIAIRDGNTAAQ